MAGRDEIVDAIASFTLFADLGRPQLEAVAGQLEEAWYGAGTRILRQGLSGSGLFFVLDGECSVQVDGEERARLGRGEFFGEISVLLGEAPVADVAAVGAVRCLTLAGPLVEPFLVANPRVTFRMLQAMGRRLRNATAWRN